MTLRAFGVIRFAGARRWSGHAVTAGAAIMLAVVARLLLHLDRQPPVVFFAASVDPVIAAPGTKVGLTIWDTWTRACSGDVSREIVGSDGVIHAYRIKTARVPVRMGTQKFVTQFYVPHSMPPGPATYQSVVRFEDCGVTSRLWPLEVTIPPVKITVIPADQALIPNGQLPR